MGPLALSGRRPSDPTKAAPGSWDPKVTGKAESPVGEIRRHFNLLGVVLQSVRLGRQLRWDEEALRVLARRGGRPLLGRRDAGEGVRR